MSTAFIVLVLSLLLGLQPVTTDLYLPALPALTQDLGATVAQAQLTLSGLLLAFGLSQLVWGPGAQGAVGPARRACSSATSTSRPGPAPPAVGGARNSAAFRSASSAVRP